MKNDNKMKNMTDITLLIWFFYAFYEKKNMSFSTSFKFAGSGFLS